MEYMWLWWRQMMSGYVIYLVSVLEIIKGGKDIISEARVGSELSSLYVERSARCSSILLM